jgi:nicotinate-nucleotide pyrophosphorylase (carboxylating)
MDIPASIIELIKHAIKEDVGHGDVTSSLLVPDDNETRALYIAKGNFVIAGFPFALKVFNLLDERIQNNIFFNEGSRVRKGDILGEVSGKTQVLLAGERISLNILQRLSGIATLTSQYVEAVRGTKVKISDTRKTTPCHRMMEKYAVKMGGGINHRFGLFDGILIKDNHIETVGSIKEAIKRAKKGHHLTKIEVEIEHLNDLKDAIAAGADIVMLDNMSVEDMKKAVRIAAGKVIIEASGNIKLKNVRSIAETGVDIISVGALTHSAPSADISLKIVQ